MSISKILGAAGLLAIVGFSSHNAFAAVGSAGMLENMCVCASAQTEKLPGAVNPCLSAAKAQFAEAARLGDTAAGRQIIIQLARITKQLSKCDVGLATSLAELAVNTPGWAQVAFGNELDGKGTASVGGGSPPIGGGGSNPTPGSAG